LIFKKKKLKKEYNNSEEIKIEKEEKKELNFCELKKKINYYLKKVGYPIKKKLKKKRLYI
jgi:hypothetical protein